jgi:DnaJ-class molecular chaperone
MNYYNILGIPQNATHEEIILGHQSVHFNIKEIKKKDHNKGKTLKKLKKEFDDAFEILSNPEKKKQYDNTIGNIIQEKKYESDESDGEESNQINIILNNLVKKLVKEADDKEKADSDNQIPYYFECVKEKNNDLYKTKGTDIYYTLPLSLEEVHFGARKKIVIERIMENKNIILFPVCIHTHRGVESGEIIKVEKKGNMITLLEEPAEIPGNIIIQIFVQKHNVFTRSGNDLLVSIELTPSEAGKKIDKTITGINQKPLTIVVNKLTRTDEIFTIQNRGLCSVSGSYGNLIVNFIIVIQGNPVDKCFPPGPTVFSEISDAEYNYALQEALKHK